MLSSQRFTKEFQTEFIMFLHISLRSQLGPYLIELLHNGKLNVKLNLSYNYILSTKHDLLRLVIRVTGFTTTFTCDADYGDTERGEIGGAGAEERESRRG